MGLISKTNLSTPELELHALLHIRDSTLRYSQRWWVYCWDDSQTTALFRGSFCSLTYSINAPDLNFRLGQLATLNRRWLGHITDLSLKTSDSSVPPDIVSVRRQQLNHRRLKSNFRLALLTLLLVTTSNTGPDPCFHAFMPSLDWSRSKQAPIFFFSHTHLLF